MYLSEFGENFLLLALRIDKHNNGYVDFYFGPKKLRKIVDNEVLTSPNKLLTDCKALQKNLFKQGFNKKREHYLEKMLTAMRTSIEVLNGIDIPIKEQFLKFYDVPLLLVNEAKLNNLKEEFNEAYGGFEGLEEKMNDLRIRRTVPEAEVFVLFKKALNIVKLRTKELFVDFLPKKERIIINLAKNKNANELKWSCYNWYLGYFCSCIDINPNFNIYWTSILSTAAHEGYPGHHTEFSVKEQKLYRELNQFEHSLLLLNSPKLIISEGIAEIALNILYNPQEQAEIGLQSFCPDASKEDSLDVLTMQNIVREKTSLFWHNFAYHALIDKWSEEKLIQYGMNFEIFSLDNIKNQIKRIFNSVHSTTLFSYNLGRNLIVTKYTKFPSLKNFRKLLVQPILPSDLG